MIFVPELFLLQILGLAVMAGAFYVITTYHWPRIIFMTLTMTSWGGFIFLVPFWLAFNTADRHGFGSGLVHFVVLAILMILPGLIFMAVWDQCRKWLSRNALLQPWNAK